MVAVTSDAGPPFTLAVSGEKFANGTVTLAPGEITNLKITVTRQNEFKGEVQVVVMGLPAGITAPNAVSIKPNQNEAMIPLRSNGDNRYLKEKPAAVVRFVIGGYVGGGGFGSYDGAPVTATAPIALVGTGSATPAR